MQFHIKVGTVLTVKGSPMDDYVIEKITKRTTEAGTTYRIEARTVRQRCFDRALTGVHLFDKASLLEALNTGTMHIQGSVEA
jgi:hypothetical protein